jgi:uncharacterized protein YaiL (DUF2058 family)
MASRRLKTKAERAKAERRKHESQLHALLTKATPLTKKERAKVNRLEQRTRRSIPDRLRRLHEEHARLGRHVL